MDEYIAYVSQGDHLNSPKRMRTPSFQSQQSSPRHRLRHRTFSRVSIDSSSPQTADGPQILAPTPRRHLLETSESQRWLKTPPFSPISSRAPSPMFPHFGHAPFTQNVDEPRGRHLSFNSLAELDKVQEMDAPRVTVEQKVPPPVAEGGMGMGKRWIRWMHKQGMKQWVIPWVILASGCAKWCIGLGSYSGRFCCSFPSNSAYDQFRTGYATHVR
jgi:alpha-1,3-glucosyltransferase